MCLQNIYIYNCPHSGYDNPYPCLPGAFPSATHPLILQPFVTNTPCPLCITYPEFIQYPNAPTQAHVYTGHLLPPPLPQYPMLVSPAQAALFTQPQTQSRPRIPEPIRIHSSAANDRDFRLHTRRDGTQEVVEHYNFPPSRGEQGGRGWNNVYGFDTGPAPPTFEPGEGIFVGGRLVGRDLGVRIEGINRGVGPVEERGRVNGSGWGEGQGTNDSEGNRDGEADAGSGNATLLPIAEAENANGAPGLVASEGAEDSDGVADITTTAEDVGSGDVPGSDSGNGAAPARATV